jgi:beta-galactosidase
LTFVFKTALSFQGVEFERSEKAYAKLSALDCSSITGDSFTKDLEAVTGIGNNVVLEFNAMDFGEKAADEITICGCSHVDNTIHLKFFGDAGEIIRIVEFPKTDGYVEKTFSLRGLPGKNTVSFVFLPGSNFDFKWFQFR